MTRHVPAPADRAPERLLTTRQVMEQLSVSRSTLHRLTVHPDPDVRLPQPIRIAGLKRYVASEVAGWVVRHRT